MKMRINKRSPDSVVAIIQRAGWHQGIIVDKPRAVVRVHSSGDVTLLQILRFRRRVNAPIPMRVRIMMMVMMVMQVMTVTVVGRSRGRFVGVGYRVRHEGHHFTKFRREEMDSSLYLVARSKNALIIHVFDLARPHHEQNCILRRFN